MGCMKTKSLLLIFLSGLCWGPSYLFIKIALPEFPPFTLTFGRVLTGFLFLFALCFFQKLKLRDFKQHWKQFAVLGIFLTSLPSYLIASAELHISSSLAGILNSLTLIFTAILSYFFAREPFTRNTAAGIALGLAGLGLIYTPLLLKEELGGQLGILLMVLATLSYGAGTVYARKHLKSAPGLIALTFQLLIGAALFLPLSLFIDQPSFPSAPALFAVLGLGILGTGLGFYFYYLAIDLAGATYASFATLLIPILAIVYGVVFLEEEIPWNVYLGAGLIIAGVIGVNPALKKDVT